MTDTPTVAVTLGDPVGIGPEVVAKALADPSLRTLCNLVVVGDPDVLELALRQWGNGLHAAPMAAPGAWLGPTSVPVIDALGDGDLKSLPPGQLSAAAGRAGVVWAKHAAELAWHGEVNAVATAPINKEAAHMAGYEAVGHMEIYQEMTRAAQVATMLLTDGLRVVHLTTHRSLRIACDYVTRENVLAKLRLTDELFKAHGFERPRIGVAALNPHGGEGGLLGREDAEEIAPAVEDARGEGIEAIGPVPADSVFPQAIDGRYDAVLAMYHDQGHIAVKVHGWERSVTMNLGLPFLRTSVDHGTAFDIAGKGIANASGMASAIRLAANAASGRGLVLE